MTLHARRQQTCLLDTYVLEIVVEIQDRVMRCNLTRTPTPRMHLPTQTHKHLGKQAIFRAVFIKLVVKGGTFKCQMSDPKLEKLNKRKSGHTLYHRATYRTVDGFLGATGNHRRGNGQPQTGFWAHLQHNQDVFLRKKYFNPLKIENQASVIHLVIHAT